MKIFKYLSIACLFLGMSACEDDEMSVTPAISFKEKAVTVAENAKTLKVPLTLTAASDGVTYVYVGIKEGSVSGGKEGGSFCSVPSYVALENGAVRGFVELAIFDNEYPNADCTFELEITKVEGGALLGAEGNTCKVTITDDDSKQAVTIGFDTVYFAANEDAGYTEIPVTVKGGVLSGFLNFTVEAIDGTATSAGANWDYKLTTPDVKIVEEESWGVVNIVLNDAQATKEDRSFKLKITGVQGVDAADETVGVRENVRECEVVIRKVVREATFGDSLVIVGETMKPFDFSMKLTAPVDRDVTITFQPKAGATAIEGTHFNLASHQLTIKKGESIATTQMTIIDEPYGNHDRICDFEITEVTGNVDIVQGASCRLVIVNDDSSIGMGVVEIATEKGTKLWIPVRLNGVQDKRVVIDVVGEIEGGVNDLEYFMLIGKKLEILAGDSVAYAEVQVMRPQDSRYQFSVKINKITTDGLGVKVPLEPYAAECKVLVYTPTSLVATASSEAGVSGNEGGAAFLVDGNLNTYWHSKWAGAAPLPHWVQVDMGEVCNVSNVEMWRRPGVNPAHDGDNDVKVCALYLSIDGENWDTPEREESWEKIETYEFLVCTDKYRIAEFKIPKRARYIRYEVTESNRPPFAGIAEIKVKRIPVLSK